SISRRTSFGTPSYVDTEDTFMWGGEVLVPLLDQDQQATVQSGALQSTEDAAWVRAVTPATGDYQVRLYRHRHEANFEQIQYWTWQGDSPATGTPLSFWRIIDKDNNEHLYGVSRAAQIADPYNINHIYKWLHQETLDAQGHGTYIYYLAENTDQVDTTSSAEANRVQGAQKYLWRVCSGHPTPLDEPLSFLSTSQLASQAPDWYFETVYDYGQYDLDPSNTNPYDIPEGSTWSKRQDSFSNYLPGFEIRTHRLCQNVMRFHRFTTLNDATPVLTHVYRYHYDASPICSLLSTVEDIAYYLRNGSYETQYNPPLEITYSGFQPREQEYRDILESDSLSPFPGLGNGQPFVPVDLFNEGIEGFLYSDGTSDYYLRADWGAINNDTPERPLTFSQVDVQMPLPVGRFQNAPQRMLTDITANGQLDYLISKQGMTGYFEVARDEEWSSFTTLPNFPTESRNVKRHLVDVTGDGINDCLMMTYQGLRFYRSLQQEGYADPVLIEPFDLPEDFPISWESSETIKISFADMDGGGKSHLVKVTHEGLTYWPNLGHGYFGQSISMENFPSLSYQQFKDNRVFFADVDGSGTADLIVLFSDGIKVYLNQCGNSFADPIELPLPNGEVYDPLDRILFADVYGTGMACMIYSKNHVQAQQWCYQFSGGIKPYLLTSFDNNMGGKSSIEYRSSVHYYLEDQANGVDWLTRAPFPVHVVASMTATDEISGSVLTNTRSYRHSYYDGVEREFRGFGYVETLDTQVFDDTREIYDSFPAKTKTWLRTGSPDQNEITAQYQSEFYSKDLLGTSTIDYGDFTSAADQTDVPREAQLVLSGTPIRQEVYGMDETASAGIPYSVTENNHIAHLVQPKADNPYASLQIRPKETLHYHYERRPEDALIEHEVALRFDQFGHVMQSASITYPRNPDYVDALDKNGEQSKVRCHSQTALYYNLTKAATQIDSDLSSDEVYLLGIPYDQRHYHIANLSELLGSLDYNTIYAYGDLQKTLAANVPSQTQIPFASKVQYTLRSWKKNEYYYPTDTSAGSGEVAPQDSYGQIYLLNLARTSARAFLLPYQSLQTAYVQEELATIMGDFFTSSDFSSLMGTTGDYLADTDQQYWWVPSGTHTYGTATHFYLPQKYTDPKGSTTSYQYDDYNLLLLSTSDALKNTVTATAVDYQTLHPYVITDANGNSSEVLYDAHGRVLANSYYGTQTLAGESSPTKLGFDSLYGSDPYEIQSPNSLSAVLAAPYDYLQNAAGYYYYDLYSMMGQVTEQDYKTAISGIDSDALSNWWTAQLNAVLINPAGALYAAYRQFIAAADSASDFGQALSALSSDLGDAYAAFSTKQQQSIFQLLQAAISSTTLSPVHSLALMAEDYPSDSQARLTTQDYEAAISGIDSDTLSNWLAQLQKNEQIDAQDVFSGDYRGLVQTASSASDFATALGKISSALNSAFTAFGDDEEQVFNLQKTALYRRIKQLIHYSDGFGRMLQDKIKAEDGSDGFLYNSDGSISKNTSGKTISNRWLTSGHKVYNNKGQVVRQYEPYYIDTTDYVSAEELNQLGASPTNFYDPLGRVYQMYTSKGFLVRKQWSAWGMSTWDANDTLPFSPFYLVNEQNILNGDTTPPAQGSTYYDFRYYFNAEMTQAERDTYQNSLPLAWTPSQQQHDNRGLPLWMTKTDGARFTETTFTNTFPSNGKGIYQNLITVGYLATRQTRSTVEQDQQTSQQTSEWAQLTTAFPFPSLPLSQTEYQVQAPGILSILYQQKLADKAVNESAFTALGYTTVESQALWKALVGAGILDSKGMVSTKLAYPSLTGLDQEYQSLNNQIVTLLIQQWAVARPLRSFRTYDSYGRILTLADPRLAAESLVNMTYTYPATMGGKISSQSCDAGQEWKLVDVIGRPLWSRDEKGYVHTYQFDALHRPTAHLVAYQKAGSTSVTEGPVTTERMLYGESVDNPEDYNLRGKPYQHFDQAQWQYLRGGYTIQGKLVGGVTQLTKAYRVEATTTTPLLPL
ncbi:MAG: SpvB/TcaC N-terminal domain-containing protein, partial [Bacteroidota bacterium]